MTLPLIVNELLHWLTQLLATMQTHSSYDSVALGIVPYPPPPTPSHLLGSWSPPVPLQRQFGVKQV